MKAITEFFTLNSFWLLWQTEEGFFVEIPGRNCPAMISQVLASAEAAHQWANDALSKNASGAEPYGIDCGRMPGKRCDPCVTAAAMKELDAMKMIVGHLAPR